MCADLFCHAHTGLIANRDHNLHTDQPHLFKRETRGEFRRASCYALSMSASAHPITEIAILVYSMNAAQCTAAKDFIVLRNGKCEERTFVPTGACNRDVFSGSRLCIC